MTSETTTGLATIVGFWKCREACAQSKSGRSKLLSLEELGLSTASWDSDLPRPTQGLPAPSGPNPGRVRKESGKSSPGQGPKSPERVRKRVRKESESQLLDSFRTLLRLRGALFRGFCLYRFRTLFGLFWVPGPKGPGGAGPIVLLGRKTDTTQAKELQARGTTWRNPRQRRMREYLDHESHESRIAGLESPELPQREALKWVELPQSTIRNPPDRGQSRKIRFSKFPGSGLKKI